MLTRYSPAWARGDAPTFARVLGNSTAGPLSREDPVHAERIARYERNISYYTQSQYWQHNVRMIDASDFLELRVNYTGIAQRGIDTKADWLYGDPIGIHAIALDANGLPQENQKDGPGTAAKRAVDRTNQIRKYNQSNFWDWIMAVMGMTCGDFFVRVDAIADDLHPSHELLDPSFVFPDYPDELALPMRACQIQYIIDPDTGRADEDQEDGWGGMTMTEDYRLEIMDAPFSDDFDALQEDTLDSQRLKELSKETSATGAPPERLTCIYRRFEDENLVEKRDIGIPAIPIVHGINGLNTSNRRFGTDEVQTLIPKIEKYNELFFYAERVARHNSHSKLFVSGIRPDAGGIRSDFDDVLYGGPDTKAEVLTLPSDPRLLEFVTTALDRELHGDCHIPYVVEGQAEGGLAAPSGLALKIRYAPLSAITNRHHTTYGPAHDHINLVSLLFDEMVIQGQPYGKVYDYESWEYQYDWTNQMPQAMNEIIGTMREATDQRVPLISMRTAREQIPGVNPDQEDKRVKDELAEVSQYSLDTPASGGPSNGFARLFNGPTPTQTG